MAAYPQKLESSGRFNREEIININKITQIITNERYITYNNKIYYDPKGLRMGGPLSATLIELYMQMFEEK